jgi:hypothetical protein
MPPHTQGSNPVGLAQDPRRGGTLLARDEISSSPLSTPAAAAATIPVIPSMMKSLVLRIVSIPMVDEEIGGDGSW